MYSLYMCRHTALAHDKCRQSAAAAISARATHTPTYMSSYSYICVRILRDTATYVSACRQSAAAAIRARATRHARLAAQHYADEC
jgi:hypothetical protein